MRISTLFAPFSLVVCVGAASFQPLFVRVPAISAASIGQGFDKRQVSVGTQPNVPSQCTSTCDPVNNEVGLGCPLTACCTVAFETEYYNCLECVGTALNATNYKTAQNDLNLLYTTCVDMGYVLPRMELPGQNNSTSSSSTDSGAPPPTSAVAPFTTASGGVATPGSTAAATSGAISVEWRSVRRPEVLIGAAVFLGFLGLC